MLSTLAIDPSKPGNNTGWARFEGAVFVACGLWRDYLAPMPDGFFPTQWEAVHTLVIELPEIYPGARAQDPNDLIQVARAVGQWERAIRHARLVEPHPRQWKGSVPKKIHNARVLAKLAPLERQRVPDHARHDVIDAIGLGLWSLGR